MLLENKSAVIYGAAGSVGTMVARVFAREGARVFLAGRTVETLEAVADTVDGEAQVDRVDATDPATVDRHFRSVVERTGGVQISFNLIGLEDEQGRQLTEMPLDDYLRPVTLAARTQFVTATTAARHMRTRGSGVIMALTATPARLGIPLVGGFGTACSAIEGMLRTLAAEVGPDGVRVAWLRSAGSPESFGPDTAADVEDRPAGLSDADYLEMLRSNTLLKRFPSLAEVAEAATFVASDRASAMSGAAANVTCGQIVD